MSLKHFIDGEWVTPVRGGKMPVINPSTEEIICEVAAGSTEDVDKAVIAARRAFDRTGNSAWSTSTGDDRAQYLKAISQKIVEKKELLGKLEAQDCGKPHREALWDMDDVAGCFAYYADLAKTLDGFSSPIALPDDRFKSSVQKFPTGVVALIVPWNYPLLMAAWKVAPALAAGCTVILKPSEVTPLTAIELAKIIEEVGLPKGVFNLLLGDGPGVGSPLSSHPDVDKVAFTGSVPTGARVMQAASPTIKTVTLELGGKSPFIIFDDADVIEAVEWIMFGVFWTNGQICSSTSRLLIQDGIAPKVLQRLKEEAEKIYVGDVFSPQDPSMGPLVSRSQLEKVLRYVELGKKEGAQVLTGGKRPPHCKKGYFVEPTVFVNVTPNMTIWKEEIFGPVLSVMTFKSEEEAIRLANDSLFGLGAAVMSKDDARCQRIAKAMRSGMVWINCSQPCFVQCPWGGIKRSGVGRELGEWGLNNYLETKQVTEYVVKKSGEWGWFIKSKL
eukprot:TRINITY_DN313_c0_g1_i1.p1 TRINITY_DN313_c0_g1~~TRINITY_DN313_c0_g1_i1.p1  ORF type:complete len:500 (+),score=167.86 TRINITY_DN313_c0_g1_i1:397-1896(+)